MRYANLNNNRVEASKDIIGAVCPICGSSVFPACGNVNVHHFRHEEKADCDPWYEPMSEWHIKWQNKFLERFREVVIKKDQTMHIADVKNGKGTIIEFQNSPISIDEIKDRENFYGNMVWVFNAKPFINNIWEPNYYYELRSNLPEYSPIKNETYIKWSWKRKYIGLCRKPVFIDIGYEDLLWINAFYKDFLYCKDVWKIRVITKSMFIKHYCI